LKPQEFADCLGSIIDVMIEDIRREQQEPSTIEHAIAKAAATRKANAKARVMANRGQSNGR
jgi:hypothetical protein